MLLHELVRNTLKSGSKKILINLRGVTYFDSFEVGRAVVVQHDGI